MTDRLEFVVPGAPQGKGRARIGRVGAHARMFTPAKTQAYEGLIAHAAHAAMAGRPLYDGPVSVLLLIDCPIPASWSQRKQRDALAGLIRPQTKPDVDNVEKAVFDACNHVVWRDDVQVVDVIKQKAYAATPRVWVAVKPARMGAPLTDEQFAALLEAF